MVSARRSSSNRTRVENQVIAKRKLPSQPLASPSKKRRKVDDIDEQEDPSYWDHPDSGNDTPHVNGHRSQSSKMKVGISTPQKKKKKKANGTMNSSSCPRRSGMLMVADDEISLPDIFSEDKILLKSPRTPQKRLSQSPATSKSSKSKPGTTDRLHSSSKPPPRTSFNARLQAVTEKTKEKVQDNVKEQLLSRNIVNGTTKPKPPPKGPKQRELESIKTQVLGKLCGRTPIPLQGHPAQVAT